MRLDEDGVEDGDEEVEQQDVGHEQEAGHHDRVEPVARHALVRVLVAGAAVVDFLLEHTHPTVESPVPERQRGQ